jgi:tetratricopeptide (TPR) repeat protein
MKSGSNVFIALAVIMIIGYVGYFKFLAPKHKFSFGYGLDANSFPIGSVRFIKTVNLAGNMYNTDGFGGYLSYFLAPERKIFFYCHHITFNKVETYLHDPVALERCEINYAVVGREEELDMFLRKKFVPVYWEPSSVLLVRNNEQNRNLLKRYEIRFFQPLMKDTEMKALAADYGVFPGLAREIGTYLAYRNDSRIANLFVDLMSYPNSGLPDSERVSLLQRAEQYNGDNARLLTSLGIVYYKKKDLSLALQKFTKALEIDQNVIGAGLNLAYVYFDMGNYQKAAAEFGRLLSKNSLDANAVYGMALTSYQTAQFERGKELFEKYLHLAPGGIWAENARTFLSNIEWAGRRRL